MPSVRFHNPRYGPVRHTSPSRSGIDLRSAVRRRCRRRDPSQKERKRNRREVPQCADDLHFGCRPCNRNVGHRNDRDRHDEGPSARSSLPQSKPRTNRPGQTVSGLRRDITDSATPKASAKACRSSSRQERMTVKRHARTPRPQAQAPSARGSTAESHPAANAARGPSTGASTAPVDPPSRPFKT